MAEKEKIETKKGELTIRHGCDYVGSMMESLEYNRKKHGGEINFEDDKEEASDTSLWGRIKESLGSTAVKELWVPHGRG